MHTVEIAGVPIAIVNSSKDEAEEFFQSEVFKSDLLSWETPEGRSLWDGMAELFVRPSFAEEEAVFDRGFAKARVNGSADPDDEDGYLILLVPVVDPDDEEEDEDDAD
jgi:hypothetical protein